MQMFGQLVPVSGGDPIELGKKKLRIGRRDGCDILLNFSNVSGHHALLEISQGYWFIKDLNSRNGVHVDGKRVRSGWRKRIDPGTQVSIAKHQFELHYDPTELGAYGSPPQDELE